MLKNFCVRNVIIPTLLLLLLIVVDALSFAGIIPQIDFLLEGFYNWVSNQNSFVILVLSFVENLPLVNSYFPGSIVILSSMAAASSSWANILILFIAISTGAFLAHSLTFYIVKNNGIRRVEKRSNKISSIIFVLSYFHPHFAALATVRSATNFQNSKKFIYSMSICLLIWNSFWTYMVVQFGIVFKDGEFLKILFYAYLVVWVVYEIYAVIYTYKKR